MYPLLTEFVIDENNPVPQNPLALTKMIIENLPKAIVKNGEQKGKTLSSAIRFFGKKILGKRGAETSVFKNCGREIINLIDQNEPAENEGTIYPFGIVENLVCTEGFSADYLSLRDKTGLYEKESFMLLYVVSGEFTVSYFGGTFRIKPQNMVFVPADFRIEIVGTGKLIIVNT